MQVANVGHSDLDRSLALTVAGSPVRSICLQAIVEKIEYVREIVKFKLGSDS